ncbi:helix-turn-helix domain-containing protein [Streptomyces sp. NPDC051554]|uniref:helix-turn-helix domain-containing protein n=1 Tax=Streptomyces sp. NPDC051554 TaxID=3365656 RepID=UPI00379E3F68
MNHGSQPEPPLDAPFGDWLRWAFVRNGYDPEERGVQRRFADASSIPVATVSRLLRDKSQPDVSTCYALGVTFGIPVMPILVRAGHLPPEAIENEPQSAQRARTSTTEEEALTALGVVDETDRAAVRGVIAALTAKHRQEGTS